MQIQINNSKQNVLNNFEFEKSKAAFLKVEAEVIKSIQRIESEVLKGQFLSNAQHFVRELCKRRFMIEDIAIQTGISAKQLHLILALQRRDLSDEDFSSLIFFYCAVRCGYISPTSIQVANDHAFYN